MRRRRTVFVGDEVEMRCGIRGVVAGVERSIVTLEVDHDVMIRCEPWAIRKIVASAPTVGTGGYEPPEGRQSDATASNAPTPPTTAPDTQEATA